MKIVLSNYRYFISGGPERYFFSIEDMLRIHGHKVFPFSVRSSRNRPSEYEERFLSPIAEEHSTYFHEYRKNPKTIFKVLSRQFYSPEAFLRARSFAKFVGADLVYSLKFMNKMSPAVLDGFKSAGLPVVHRVSDFGLICPQAHLFDGESVCDKCVQGNFLHAVLKGCVMGSRVAGMVKALAISLHRLLRCRERIDAFVFPSRFTLEQFARAGFPSEKLHHVPTAVDADQFRPDFSEGGYILYFGRLVMEKGVHQLLEAYRKIRGDKPKLVVVGHQPDAGYGDDLVETYMDLVEFHDFENMAMLAAHIRNAMCVVVPSLWYDNLPNVLLEAYACGKPVIAPAHGCFTELVVEGETGLFYEARNVWDLQRKLEWAIKHRSDMALMGRRGRAFVETDFSPERHFDALMGIFEKVLKTS